MAEHSQGWVICGNATLPPTGRATLFQGCPLRASLLSGWYMVSDLDISQPIGANQCIGMAGIGQSLLVLASVMPRQSVLLPLWSRGEQGGNEHTTDSRMKCWSSPSRIFSEELKQAVRRSVDKGGRHSKVTLTWSCTSSASRRSGWRHQLVGIIRNKEVPDQDDHDILTFCLVHESLSRHTQLFDLMSQTLNGMTLFY